MKSLSVNSKYVFNFVSMISHTLAHNLPSLQEESLDALPVFYKILLSIRTLFGLNKE